MLRLAFLFSATLFFSQSYGKNLDIKSDKVVFDRKKNIVTFYSNVTVFFEDVYIISDELVFYLDSKNNLKKIVSPREVLSHSKSKEMLITSKEFEYNNKTKKAILTEVVGSYTGHAIKTKELEISLKVNESKLSNKISSLK